MGSNEIEAGDRNTNTGYNQSQMDNIQADGDIVQTIENTQDYRDNSGGTPIKDPNAQNFWINVCELIAELPISDTKIVMGLTGSGGLGILAMIVVASPLSGYAVSLSQWGLPMLIGIPSAIFLGLAAFYVQTDEESKCPECEERFALRTEDVRKTGRTPRENGVDIIHGERDVKCRNCEFEEIRNESWSPEELSNNQSV